MQNIHLDPFNLKLYGLRFRLGLGSRLCFRSRLELRIGFGQCSFNISFRI